MKYTIYTDGGCYPNPGPGGFGVVILKDDDPKYRKEMKAAVCNTTNNRMEMSGPIEALKFLQSEEEIDECTEIEVYSDSQYVIKAFTENWITKWKTNGWKNKNYQTGQLKEIPNKDLWEELWDLNWDYDISWNWVRGHTGIPENERCDTLATEGRLFATETETDLFEVS